MLRGSVTGKITADKAEQQVGRAGRGWRRMYNGIGSERALAIKEEIGRPDQLNLVELVNGGGKIDKN
jgi:hypothetical protein